MTKFDLYVRVLTELRLQDALMVRIRLQDVLCELLRMAAVEGEISEQDTQDLGESMAMLKISEREIQETLNSLD